MSALDPSAPGLPLVGLGGSSLPTATGADEVPVSTGAGTTYAAQTLGAAVVTGLVANLSADDAGTAIIADGAGDVQKTSADVSAILAAASASAARSALGLGTPTTLAAQARAEAQRRRGALAMRSLGTAGTASASATTDTTPTIMLSTSGVVVVYSPSAGGYSDQVFAQSGVWATRGWYLTAQGSAVRINLMQGTLQTVDLTAVGSIGWHAVAWSIPADGLSVRYSVDGGAVTTATPSSTPLTPVARSSSDTVYVATNGSGSGTICGVAYLGLWSSILSDADLALLSASPSAGAPDLSAIAGGAPAWEWAAAAFAGVQAATINGTMHAITGTPQVWMP